MQKINFFKLTIISSIIFLVVMFFYESLAYYAYHFYDGDLTVQQFIIKNYSIFMKLEPILKQSFIVTTIFLFGCSISKNILQLTKMPRRRQVILFIFTFTTLGLLIFLMLTMITYASVELYTISSFLMMLLLIIWITTIILDFIKTKNNNTSIISRVVIAVLGISLIVVNTNKVINDYKVNTSLLNSIDYRIQRYTNQLEGLDEDSKAIIQSYIDDLEEKKVPIYNVSLYAGKSVFVFYGDIEIDLFLSVVDKAKALEDRITLVESYLYTEDMYDIYTINYGLYIGGSSSGIITLLLIVLAAITLKLFPLSREEELAEISDVVELLNQKLALNIITVKEYDILLKRIGMII